MLLLDRVLVLEGRRIKFIKRRGGLFTVYMPNDLLLWQTLFISQSKQSALTRMGTSIRTKVLNILRVVCDFSHRALCDEKCHLRPPFCCHFCVKLWIIRPTSAGFSVFVLDWHWRPFYAKSGDNLLKDSLHQICHQPLNQHLVYRRWGLLVFRKRSAILSFSASLVSLNWKSCTSNLIPMPRSSGRDWFPTRTPF